MIDEKAAQLFKLQAEICHTLADPTRLMILHELRRDEMSVGQLKEALSLPQSNVSRHLAVLRERGSVRTRRDGTSIYYSLSDSKIATACDLVREVLEGRMSRTRDLASAGSGVRAAIPGTPGRALVLLRAGAAPAEPVLPGNFLTAPNNSDFVTALLWWSTRGCPEGDFPVSRQAGPRKRDRDLRGVSTRLATGSERRHRLLQTARVLLR